MSSSNSRRETICSICLKRLKFARIGKPEPCDHIFCYTCILEWAKSINTCPVDRIRFNTLEVFDSIDGECVEKVHVADKDIQSEPQEFTCCEVCHDHSRENELLLCDGCDKGYHLDCLTQPLPEVPEGDWYCPVCEPIVFAQYQKQFLSPENRSDFEWTSSSGSDIQVRCSRNGSKPLITDSNEDSESDSDVDEFLLKRRTRQNLCAGGVVISDSSDDEIPLPALPLKDESEIMYIDLLRNFSKRSQSTAPAKAASRVTEEPNLLSKSRVRIKSCSVPIVPIQSKVEGQDSNPNPTLQAGTSQPSTSSSQPSTSQRSQTESKKSRHRYKRKRKVPRVTFNNKKKRSMNSSTGYCQRSHRKQRQMPAMYIRRRTSPHAMGTRSRARTVATYTPQQNVFRAAARESYKHSDLDTGLKNARKIIFESESGTSFRHPCTPIKSGYTNKSYRKIPLRAAPEIRKRSAPEKKRLLINSSTYGSPASSSSVSTARRNSCNLLDDIYHGLDVLNTCSRDSTIQRDGTIIAQKADDDQFPAKQTVSHSLDSDCLYIGSSKTDHKLLVLDSISDTDSAGNVSDYVSRPKSRARIPRPSPSPEEALYSVATIDVSSVATVRQIVKTELNHHYSARNLTDHQYHRILQRATEKIMKGRPTNMDRVKKLVLDFVVQYESFCQ